MAKMFYTLDEAAGKLGVSETQIKQMAGNGQLQQFRDGAKLMFKREQIDAMAAGAASAGGGSSLGLSDSGGTDIPLADTGTGASGGTGEIPLADTGAGETGVMEAAATAKGKIPLPSVEDSGLTGTGEIPLADLGDTGDLQSSAGGTSIPLTDSGADSSALELSSSGDTDHLGMHGSASGSSGSGGALKAADAADSGVISLSGDTDLDGSGMGGSVLGASGLRGSELAGGDELTSLESETGSSGLLSGLTGEVGSSGLLSGSGLGSSDAMNSPEDSGLGADTDGTGLIDLAENPKSPRNGRGANQASGISVFDADEVDAADPMAQTIVTDSPTFTPGSSGAGEDLTLDSVGSGSGLLDLTREADDTSLGAELLDEIYPDAGETTTDTRMDTATGSSGVFDGSVTLEAKDASNMELPEATAAGTAAGATVVEQAAQVETLEALPLAATAAPVAVYEYAEGPYDGPASAMTSGFLFCALAVLVVGLIIAVSALAGVPNMITATMSKDANTLYMFAGGGAAVAVVVGVAGYFVGKALNK